LEDEGKEIKLDPDVDPPWNPAFPQKDKPVYHGFWVERDFDFDGFQLGLITEPEFLNGEEYGDGFLIAPDNSRCGLIYEVGPVAFYQISGNLKPNRWGVWNVTVTNTMTTEEGKRKNLAELVGMLKREWESWKDR
jgi:hypothetical protein